jgi:hypothetical protein
MASILKVDELQGIVSAGDITVTVGATATQSLHDGIAKALYNYNNYDATAVLNDSKNISSISDDSTGQFTAAYTNVFSNTAYCVGGTGGYQIFLTLEDSRTEITETTTIDTKMATCSDSGSPLDNKQIMGIVHGDLA